MIRAKWMLGASSCGLVIATLAGAVLGAIAMFVFVVVWFSYLDERDRHSARMRAEIERLRMLNEATEATVERTIRRLRGAVERAESSHGGVNRK